MYKIIFNQNKSKNEIFSIRLLKLWKNPFANSLKIIAG